MNSTESSERNSDPDTTVSMRRKYLRWSIPSLVLAVVSGMFAVASYRAQQVVLDRYEAIVKRYVALRETDGMSWSVDSMRQASLAAKRLVVESPDAADAARDLALVDFQSLSGLMRFISSSGTDMGQEERAQWFDLARTTRQRGIDSMRRAAKLNGPAAADARLWVLDWQFREERANTEPSEASLDAMRTACEGLLDSGATAKLLLADLLIRRAALAASGADQPDGSMERSLELLRALDGPMMERDASLIEASAYFDPSQARIDAIKGISKYLQPNQGTLLSWRQREALFRIRLHVGNIQEAFDFAWTSLGEISVLDRDVFRWNVASSALRSMAFQLSKPDLNSDRNIPLLFGFALRFAPDSRQVSAILERVLSKDEDLKTAGLRKGLDQTQDIALRDAVQWFIRLAQTAPGESVIPPPSTTQGDPLLAPGTLLALVMLKQGGKLENRNVLQILNALVTSWQSNLELHSLRSELAIDLEEYSEAIESLEILKSRFPNDTRISKLLETIRSRNMRSQGDLPSAKAVEP